MKRFTLIVLLFAMTVPMLAEHVELPTAQQAALSFMRSKTGATTAIQPIEYTDRSSFDNFYVFGNDHSFVIVAADDNVHPILAYSKETGFGTTSIPENIMEWLRGYEREIDAIKASKVKATKEIEEEWNLLLNGRCWEPKTRTSVDPLLTTRWDQNKPYNGLCPIDAGNGSGHAYSGCVATAMAQVMNYWEHPVKGIGSYSYVHATYGTQTANFGNTTYDWDHMKNMYSNGYTATDSIAVATLIYHCGVSVDMNYGPGSSSAFSSNVTTAWTTYFDYSYGLHLEYRSYVDSYGTTVVLYEDEVWISMLKDDLNLGRPLYYSGNDETSGHAFVCDGYDENDYFHFNWGWSGNCDGYYVIGALNPGAGGIGSGVHGQYNEFNAVVFGCEPNTPPVNPPTNLATTVNGRNVTLTWSAVGAASSYKVYCDDYLLGNVTGTSYTDSNVSYGPHTYYVKSVMSNGTTSLKSNPSEVEVHFPGPIPTNLQATATGTNVSLSWTAPASETAILQYGTGDSQGCIGYSESEIYWAQRYPRSILSNYAGMAINKISYYFRNTGTYTVSIYKGNELSNTELMYQTNYTATATGWKDINIATPMAIDCAQDLWIVMYAPSSISYPVSYCQYSGTGVENSAYYSTSGYHWYLYGNGSYSWTIKISITDGTYTYNLYRDGTMVAGNLNGTTYADNGLTGGPHEYHVTTNYYGGESDASNSANVTVNGTTYVVTATADPAEGGEVTGGGTYYQGEVVTVSVRPNENYVVLGWMEDGVELTQEPTYTFTVTRNRNLVARLYLENDIEEMDAAKVMVYPNPANDKLCIESEQHILRCELFTLNGSQIISMDMNNLKVEIPLEHLPSGMYLVKLTTETQVLTRRFTKE